MIAFLTYVGLGLIYIIAGVGTFAAVLAALAWLVDNTQWSPPKPPPIVGRVARLIVTGLCWAFGLTMAVMLLYIFGGGPPLGR